MSHGSFEVCVPEYESYEYCIKVEYCAVFYKEEDDQDWMIIDEKYKISDIPGCSPSQ